MSDLQISLLGIGACVVAGVYLFNVWQERQFKRRADAAFAREHDDVLMPPEAAPEDVPPERIEPALGAPVATQSPKSKDIRTRAANLVDPVIDYVVEVELDAPMASAGLHEELLALAAGWNKPVLVAGCDDATGEWQVAGMDSLDKHVHLRFALQMSNRAGCVEQKQLSAFRAAVEDWAKSCGGRTRDLDIEPAHAIAVQLDHFCADVDIAIGVNVVTRDGSAFSGTKIRALAEAGGLKLESDGVFYKRGDSGNTLYTLDNHEPMPFMPEQMKTLSTSGVTFLLDVPRVSDPLREFEGMLGIARNFAATLGGALVDDNRKVLADDAIEKIRHQLTGILAKMEAGQIAAGGVRALRLFS